MGFAAPVSATTDAQAIGPDTAVDVSVAAQAQALASAPGVSPVFDSNVPTHVRSAVVDVVTQFESVFAFPPGSVQVAVGWTVQGGLGVGGPVLVQRDGAYYPAAVADVVFGGHHAKQDVDGFVSMASNQPWYFGSRPDVPPTRYDFRSAFAHELVHALGFSVDTTLNARGQRVLSGRTQVFDQNLSSGGRPLVNLSAARQSAAFAADEIWFDVGGGWLLPLDSEGGRGASHFGNAVSPTDTEPGALMYGGLIQGARHQLDAPVVGALSRLGYPTTVPPAEPADLRFDGRVLRWNNSSSASAPPAEVVRIRAYRSGRLLTSTDLPGAVEQYVVPASVRDAALEISLIDRTGNITSIPVSGTVPIMAEAGTLSQLVAAPDYLPRYGDVLRLYWAFFNREPDVGGAAYWIGVHRSGVSLDAIAEAFAGSGEFRSRYGKLRSNEDYLAVIYQNVLGRERDNDGFVYWLGLLNRGRLTRGTVVRWIAAAPEFIGAHPY